MLADDGNGSEPVGGSGRSCPDTLSRNNASYIDTLCQMIVPRSGKIWFELPSTGTSCWCECEAMKALSPVEVDELIAKRRLADRAIVLDRVTKWASFPRPNAEDKKDTVPKKLLHFVRDTSITGPAGLPRSKFKLRRSTRYIPLRSETPLGTIHASIAEAPPFCPWGDWEFPFGDGYVRVCDVVEQVRAAYPHFRIETIETGKWPEVYKAPELRRLIATGQPITQNDLMVIEVPDEFMAAEEVLGEMLVWMLLHEVGHGVGTADLCNPEVPVSCEGGADYWAAAVGLRQVYGDGDAFRDVSKAAEEQLEEYSRRVYAGDMNRHGAMGCDCTLTRSCDHPPAWCRVKTIELGRWADKRRAACSRNWCDGLAECPDCPTPGPGAQ